MESCQFMRRWCVVLVLVVVMRFSKSRDTPYITNPKTKQGGVVGKGKHDKVAEGRARKNIFRRMIIITITLQTTASNLPG